jgi:hypothetical protein
MGTMTPDHPRWREFIEYLATFLERCDHTHKVSVEILKDMQCDDISGSLAIFKRYGGYCDCEVGYNVEYNWKNERGATPA